MAQYFPDGSHEIIGDDLDARAAVYLAKDYTDRPAAQIGIIQRVTIIDGGNCIVFDWRYGEGVVFPTPDMRRQAQAETAA